MAVFSQTETLVLEKRRFSRGQAGLWVSAREAFWIALDTLRAHKLRTFLTLLGVVIATTTLIVVMSVVNGMNLYIADHIANLGANVFVLSQFNWAAQDEEWLRERRQNKPIRLDDFQFLKGTLPGYKNIGASAWFRPSPDVYYKGKTLYDLDFSGQTPDMINMEQQQVDYGRFFTEAEYDHDAAVCFIGQDLVDNFFPNVDPLEKTILIGGQPFRVIGVAKKIGKTLGQSEDYFVQIPLTTLQKVFMARPRMNVVIQAGNVDEMDELKSEVTALMRARHHLTFHQRDDFGLNASDTIMGLWQQLTGSIFGMTIGVVAVFMVVGGIVIMNIMLASVTERTHEIGIRKSLGARRRDILMQFLVESALMAGTGGVIGILLAMGISKIVDMFFTSSVPLSAVLVGLFLSTAIGLFFGIYPANKAARLDPIEALRTEA